MSSQKARMKHNWGLSNCSIVKLVKSKVARRVSQEPPGYPYRRTRTLLASFLSKDCFNRVCAPPNGLQASFAGQPGVRGESKGMRMHGKPLIPARSCMPRGPQLYCDRLRSMQTLLSSIAANFVTHVKKPPSAVGHVKGKVTSLYPPMRAAERKH
eukprot:1160884-Pelagomonas_calceolata.AAC.1